MHLLRLSLVDMGIQYPEACVEGRKRWVIISAMLWVAMTSRKMVSEIYNYYQIFLSYTNHSNLLKKVMAVL